jgi:hypothetical protein
VHPIPRWTLVGLALVSPIVCRAQEPTFHAGQWGAEFNIGTGANATLLRFTSPNAAWLMEFSGSASSIGSDVPDGSTTKTSFWNGSFRLGHRTYSSGSTVVRPFHSFGGLVSGAQTNNGSTTQDTWSFGAFVDLGATWLVTPHLGLSGLGELNGSYFNQTSRQSSNGTQQKLTSTGWNVGIGRLRVVASVYF